MIGIFLTANNYLKNGINKLGDGAMVYTDNNGIVKNGINYMKKNLSA